MLHFFTKGDFRGVELQKTKQDSHIQTKPHPCTVLCFVFKDSSFSTSILLPGSARTTVVFAGGNVAVSDWRAEFCPLLCH